MCFHHAVAGFLLFAALLTNFWRFALLVLVLHDGCDVFLAGAKHAGYERRDTAKKVSFALLVATWPVTRLGIFSWVLYQVAFPPPGWREKTGAYPYFLAALASLLALNVAWYAQILRIAFSGNLRDSREARD